MSETEPAIETRMTADQLMDEARSELARRDAIVTTRDQRKAAGSAILDALHACGATVRWALGVPEGESLDVGDNLLRSKWFAQQGAELLDAQRALQNAEAMWESALESGRQWKARAGTLQQQISQALTSIDALRNLQEQGIRLDDTVLELVEKAASSLTAPAASTAPNHTISLPARDQRSIADAVAKQAAIKYRGSDHE